MIEVEYRDPSTGRMCVCPDWSKLPGEEPRKVRCKRRGCPVCGVNWARDWRRVMAINFAAKHGPVVLVSITAPGADVLPWDEAHCAGRHRHGGRHSGKRGCRVQQRAAREWSEFATWRWSELRKAAIMAARRALRDELGFLGPAPTLLGRVWEPQKRGVPHLHLVLGYATADERRAAQQLVVELKRLAGRYVFGFVDCTEPITGEEASRYLSSYLTGRNAKRKDSIRDNISNPVMPRSLIWITPALTSTRPSERIAAMRERLGIRRGTGVTMRLLRRARHLWAFLEGRVESAPVWRDTEDALRTALAFLQAYRSNPPPVDVEQAVGCVRDVDRAVKKHGRYNDYARGELLEFAFSAASACFPAATGSLA